MSIKYFFSQTALFLLIYLIPGFLVAQPKVYQSGKPSWVHVPADLNLKQNPRDVSDGYYLKLYDYQVHAEEQTSYVHIVRDIISEAGIQNGAEIWISFAPDYQKLTFHEVSVIRNGKKMPRLNVNNFKVIATEQDASSFIYNSNYTAYLILDDIRIGDQIEYSYSLKGDNPVFKNKFFEDIYLQTSVPVSHLYACVLISEKRDLIIKEHNNAKKAVRKSDNGLVRLEWEDKMVKAPKYEANSPSWYDNYRHVQLTEYKDWGEVADWAKSINPAPTAVKGELQGKTNQLLIESKGDKKLFANNAIQFVQDDIRYTGIEIGEYSHRANHPEKVFKQRYGDCKDKSLLLVTLLEQANIEACIALVHTRLAHKIENEAPSPSAFNHAIVYFKINDKPYWVDPTISYQGGTLESRSFPHNGTALLLQDSGDRIRSMRFDGEGNVNSVETYSLAVKDSTTANLTVQTTYTGWQADVIRSQMAYNSIQGVENGYLNYYSKLFPSIEITDSLRITDDRLANIIIVEENYLVPDFFTKNSETNRYEVSFYANMIYEQLPSLSGKRESPIAINYPVDIDYTVRVISPYGWNIQKSTTFLDRESYLFGSSAKTKADTLFLNYQFKYHTPEVSAAKSSEFVADIKNIENKQLSYSISLPSFDINGMDSLSWLAIFYSVLLFAIFGLIGNRIYNFKIQPSITGEYNMYNSIGGWLILPLIGLALTPIRMFVDIIRVGFYKTSLWNSFGESLKESLAFKGLMIFELTANIFLICFAILCLILLIKRRTIFPRLIIWYFLLTFIVHIADFALYHMLGFNIISAFSPGVNEIIRSLLVIAIWTPYMLRSVRVKGTFINP